MKPAALAGGGAISSTGIATDEFDRTADAALNHTSAPFLLLHSGSWKMSGSGEALRRDFRVFLFVVWRHLGLPPPTAVQYDIARYLQLGPRRKMVMAFRGVGKSWIYAAVACWRLYRDTERKIIVVSATKMLAESISQFMRRLIEEIGVLAPLRPRHGQRDGVSAFDVGPARAAKDPSVRSIGINGQITGSRADEILADDVEALSNSASHPAREKLREQVKEFDAVLKPGGVITYLGTPQSFDSMYLALPDRGYQIRIWPAEVPRDLSIYGDRLAPYVLCRHAEGAPAGDPLDPKRFSVDDLAERRASYGRAGYALQFMLDTSQVDTLRHPLRLGDMIAIRLGAGVDPPSRMIWGDAPELRARRLPALGFADDAFRRAAWVSEERAPFERSVMAIDPSGRGSDETGYAVLKSVHAQLFLMASGGLKGGYEPETLQRLARIAARENVDEIVIEANFGDGMFTRLFAPHLTLEGSRARLSEQRHSVQKEQRVIDTLEPVLMQHRLCVADDVVLRDAQDADMSIGRSLFFQLTRLTRQRGSLPHDDRLDALALAVSRFGQVLNANPADAEDTANRRRERRAAKELRQELTISRRQRKRRAGRATRVKKR